MTEYPEGERRQSSKPDMVKVVVGSLRMNRLTLTHMSIFVEGRT